MFDLAQVNNQMGIVPDTECINMFDNKQEIPSLTGVTVTQYQSGSSTSSSPSDKHLWETNSAAETTPQRYIKKGINAFVQKLWNMIENKKNFKSIYWHKNGKSFFVSNAKQFASTILPVNFKHRNFCSFVRQLNMYGFRKINKQPRGQRNSVSEVWEFFHINFKRDHQELLELIKRKTIDMDASRRDPADNQALLEAVQETQLELSHEVQCLQEELFDVNQSFENFKKVQLQHDLLIQKYMANENNQPNSSLAPVQDEYFNTWEHDNPQSSTQPRMTLDHNLPNFLPSYTENIPADLDTLYSGY